VAGKVHPTGMWKVNYCSLMTTLSGTDVVKLRGTEVSIRGAVPPHSLGFFEVRRGHVFVLYVSVCLGYVRYRVRTL